MNKWRMNEVLQFPLPGVYFKAFYLPFLQHHLGSFFNYSFPEAIPRDITVSGLDRASTECCIGCSLDKHAQEWIQMESKVQPGLLE